MLWMWLTAAWADPADGAAVYAEHCVTCHGKRGRATFPGLMMGAGSFASARFWRDRPRQRLRESVVQGGEALGLSKAMPAYAERLTAAEIDAVLAFVDTLRPRSVADEEGP
ncbi:MAG: cytochrome c [Myxococcales bacterium]|nr:cytochrome c [Myxococcales bacterium]